MIDVDALQQRLAARAAGEVLVWSAAHERGDDAEAAARDERHGVARARRDRHPDGAS
jgi:hypothetical protein